MKMTYNLSKKKKTKYVTNESNDSMRFYNHHIGGHITYYIDKEDLTTQFIKVILYKLDSKLDNDVNIQLTVDDCNWFKELKKKWSKK